MVGVSALIDIVGFGLRFGAQGLGFRALGPFLCMFLVAGLSPKPFSLMHGVLNKRISLKVEDVGTPAGGT